MQTQNRTHASKVIVIITMMFCIVFAPTLKSAFDLTNHSKKTVTQQILEEEEGETKELKNISKVVYTKHNFTKNLSILNLILASNITADNVLLKHKQPCLAIHTPPPDLL